ncbi:M20 family metallopeptidase [Sunxiuqinia elliptica]
MNASDAILLTQKLVELNTVNPPGNEAQAAKVVGELLEENGFHVAYYSFGENRLHLVAENARATNDSPVIFSGHFDTVPFDVGNWNEDPLGGEIKEGKLFGRGASDMKSGVAAMVVAAILAVTENPDAAVRLLLTAGEETGCQGAAHLVEHMKHLGKARGIVVGEPTANIPAIGHKGGLYLRVTAQGRTAHSSMPHLGDNAIYKVARALLKAERFKFSEPEDGLLGWPTINVGTVRGGLNLNSVADFAEFTIDIRSTSCSDHNELLARLKDELGEDVRIEVLVDLPAVSTHANDLFVHSVYRACGLDDSADIPPKSLPYLTDGAVLQAAFDGAPTVILGPGLPEMAHKDDEYCFTENIMETVEIYKKIILKGEI